MNRPLPRADLVAALTTDEIKDELWLEIARYNARPNSRAALLPHALQAPPAPPSAPMTLPALLALDGAAFIDAAYQTILGRAPDDAGIAYFMRAQAAGVSKIVLLGGLQHSAEGRHAGTTVNGLRRRYFAHRLYRLPVLGAAARLAGATLRRAGLSSALAGAQPGRRLAEDERLAATIAACQDMMERRARAQDAQIEAAAQHIATLQARLDALAAANGASAALDTLTSRLAVQEQAARTMRATLDTQASAVSGAVARSLDSERRLTALEDSSLESLIAMSDSLEDHASRLARLDGLLDGEAIAAQIASGADALRESLDERLHRAEATVAQNRQDVIDQERRIGLMLETLRRRDGAIPAALQPEDDRAVAQLYIDFEDRFRGTRADIKQRLRFYLPILAESDAGAPSRPVVDIGCGRGEFLEVLREAGRTARGVDANAAMAAACQALGLDCSAGDALAYLATQPPGSLGAVTGFHIVEHLPFNTMVRLFDAALAALAPGGLLVFETPNPANLLVASRWFYLDPTHRNPLPGEMLAMIAEARGFCRVSIVELHPTQQRFGGNDRVLREQLDRLFHGPQDYALLARKP